MATAVVAIALAIGTPPTLISSLHFLSVLVNDATQSFMTSSRQLLPPPSIEGCWLSSSVLSETSCIPRGTARVRISVIKRIQVGVWEMQQGLGSANSVGPCTTGTVVSNLATEVRACDRRSLASVIPRTNFLKQTSAVVNYSGGDVHSPSR